MAITSGGSSAEASQAVGPNGTEWRAEVSMTNRSQNVTEDRLENVQYGEENYTVEFDGYITAPTPCHTITHQARETDDGFVLNVVPEYNEPEGNQSGPACAQVLTMVEYDAEFSTGQQFDLEVKHDNQTVRTLEHPGVGGEEKDTGVFSSLMNWFSSLF